jgi:hypothetical protein
MKAITINDQLSIAYAGYADPALHIVQQVPAIYRSSGLGGVLESLHQYTACESHFALLPRMTRAPSSGASGQGRFRACLMKPALATALFCPS